MNVGKGKCWLVNGIVRLMRLCAIVACSLEPRPPQTGKARHYTPAYAAYTATLVSTE